jgi:hypothetical protein
MLLLIPIKSAAIKFRFMASVGSARYPRRDC